MSEVSRRSVDLISLTVGVPAALYLTVLTVLMTFPSLQAYAIYLHTFTLTGTRDLRFPTQSGLLQNQAMGFHMTIEGSKPRTFARDAGCF